MAITQTKTTPRSTTPLEQDRSTHEAIRDQFAEQGYWQAPVRVLSPGECRRFRRTVNDARRRPPMDWEKGHAATSRAFYEIATHPAIIEVVAALLGDDVMLWGASIQSRSPDDVHPWHSDIESSDPSGKTVAVWIGLEQTSRDSSLLVIPYSHHFGVTVQEARHEHGKGRAETTSENIVRWARGRDARSRLVQLDMTDGEALFFDGRLWHYSHNVSGTTRHALLLQYATPDTMIRFPDLNRLDWPFRILNLPRPACVLLRGSDKAGINRVVPAPLPSGVGWSTQLTSRVYPLQIPLPSLKEQAWKPYPIFTGSTADVRSLSCHVSVLSPGQCPHPPHRHDEEELLVLLAGEIELILPDGGTAAGDQRMRLRPGEFVYYPARFAHTLRTAGETPANYLMFKWVTDETKTTGSALTFGRFSVADAAESVEAQEDFRPRLVFAGPTAYLRTLHCHVSTLKPGAGYEPHVDAYDIAIVVLEGECETLGERVRPYGVIFCPAGEPHGMRNLGGETAKYIVFEFHGSQTALADALPSPAPSLLVRITDPRRWARMLKRLVRRVPGTT